MIGVLLCAAIALVLYASRWRAGDLGLMGLLLGLGFGLAYVLDNVVHDDNGSQTDQAVPVLVVPSIALALWVLARTRSIARAAHACVVVGAALGVAAVAVALATRDATFVALAVPSVLLFGAGLAWTGVGLLRLSAATRGQPRPATG